MTCMGGGLKTYIGVERGKFGQKHVFLLGEHVFEHVRGGLLAVGFGFVALDQTDFRGFGLGGFARSVPLELERRAGALRRARTRALQKKNSY